MIAASPIARLRCLAAAAAFLPVGLSLSAPSMAGLCTKTKGAAPLQVIVDGGEVAWDHTLDSAGIKQIADRHRNYVTGSWYRPIGLTTATLTSHYSTHISVQKSSGGYCAYLTDGRVEVGYSDTTIYIDQRYRKGTCAYRVIRDHELKHLAANRETLSAYKPKIEKTLRKFVQAKPGIFVQRKAQAESAYLQALRKRLEPVMRQMEAERNRRHAKLDSRDSYQHEQAKCESW